MVSVLFLCVNNIFCSVPFYSDAVQTFNVPQRKIWFTVAVKITKKREIIIIL